MTFEVEVGGRTVSVAVERTDRAGRFRITLNGAARLVDVSPTGEFGLSLLEEVDGGLSSRDFQIVPTGRHGELLVRLEGRTSDVIVNGRRSAHADGALHGHGQVTIVAPMPGRIVRVLAAAGDAVEARQPVIVVEAMKMENELRAPRAGRITEIAVTPGASVEAGRILAVIE
jgi:acetyl/propionyl-CoA carboxylase alpha subunit